jgi:UDP-2,3-diacylglucosamine hydrolase
MNNIRQLSFNFPSNPFAAHQQKVIDFPDDSNILFLADVHLGAHDIRKRRLLEQELLQLLKYCQRRSIQLIILGDLFDYWLEYNGWHPSLGKDLLQQFRSYHAHHTQTLYITGNHDHWHQHYLRDCGFEVEDEFRILRTSDRNILVMHGDGLADPVLQLPRSRLNRLLRSTRFNKIYRTLLPPSLGLSIMKHISSISKWMESEQKSRERSILDEWARQLMTQSNVDAVVCGHNHKPQVLSFNEGTYLNTGAFALQYTLGRYTNSKFELVRWDASTNDITPSV